MSTNWKKFIVNRQNIEKETERATLINFPHSSQYDGYSFWVPSKLVRKGSHSYEFIVSVADNMTFTARKYGKGKFNKFDVIDECTLMRDDVIEAFGGEVVVNKEKYKLSDIEEVVVHKPQKLQPVETQAREELKR